MEPITNLKDEVEATAKSSTVSEETIEKIENINWGTFQEFIEKIAKEKEEE